MKAIALLLITMTLGAQFAPAKVLLLLQTNTNGVIDDGLELLNALLQSAENELAQVTQKSEDSVTHLNEKLEEQDSAEHDFQSECMALSDDLVYMESQLASHKDDIEQIQSRIKAIEQRITTLQSVRCSSNDEWLNFIRSSKYILNLIQFLRQSLQQYNSFAEIHNMSSLLEKLVILDQQDDDGKIVESLTTINKSRNLEGVRKDLLALLDQIEKSIKAKVNTSQTNEIITTTRVGDFLYQLALEINYYEGELAKINSLFGDDPQQALADKRQELSDCENGLNGKIDHSELIKEHIEHKIIKTEDLEAKLLAQKNIVLELIEEYKKGLVQISERYKLRVDDYAEDQTFDNTQEFQSRKLIDTFGDKETNFADYIDGVLSGAVQPVSEPETVIYSEAISFSSSSSSDSDSDSSEGEDNSNSVESSESSASESSEVESNNSEESESSESNEAEESVESEEDDSESEDTEENDDESDDSDSESNEESESESEEASELGQEEEQNSEDDQINESIQSEDDSVGGDQSAGDNE